MALVNRIIFLVAAVVLAITAVSAAPDGAPVEREPRQAWQTGAISSENLSDRTTCVNLTRENPCRRLFPGLRTCGYPSEPDAKTHLTSYDDAYREFRIKGLDDIVRDQECLYNFPVVASFICSIYFPPCTSMPNNDALLAYPCDDVCNASRDEIGGFNNSEILALCPSAITFLACFPEPLDLLECGKYNPPRSDHTDRSSVCIDLRKLLAGLYINGRRVIPDCRKRSPTVKCLLPEPPKRPRPTCSNLTTDNPCRRLFPGLQKIGYPPEPDDRTHLVSYDRAYFEFRGNGLEEIIGDPECFYNFPIVASFLCSMYFPPCTSMPDGENLLVYPCDDVCNASHHEMGGFNNSEILELCPSASKFLRSFSEPLDLLDCGKFPSERDSELESICIPLDDFLEALVPRFGPRVPDCEISTTTGNCVLEVPEEPTEPPEPELALCSEMGETSECDECSSTSFRDKLGSKNMLALNYCIMQFAFKVRFIGYIHGPRYWGLEFEMLHSYFDDCNKTLPVGTIFTINTTRRAKCCLCDKIVEYLDKDSDIFVIAGKEIERDDGTCGRHLRHTAKHSLIVSCSDPTRYSEDKMEAAVAIRSARPSSGDC